MRSLLLCLLGVVACSGARPAPESTLPIKRVVLYRSGVGYFERQGVLPDETLKLRARRDQLNDLLKSLTVVDANGRALSISLPLAASAFLRDSLVPLQRNAPLSEVLSALKGSAVQIRGREGVEHTGRITLVEPAVQAPPMPLPLGRAPEASGREGYVSLLSGAELQRIPIADIATLRLQDKAMALELERQLDALGGQAGAEYVTLDVQLSEAPEHAVTVAYVAEAPLWKPTYRLVIADKSEDSLLQAWAIVDNTSGESWQDVSLSLAAGTPIAFLYDLHTPREVQRPDMSPVGNKAPVRVAVGESSYSEDDEEADLAMEEALASGMGDMAGGPQPMRSAPRSRAMKAKRAPMKSLAYAKKDRAPSLDAATLARSSQGAKRVAALGGLSQFEISENLDVPAGRSTLVALLSEGVRASSVWLYARGGAGGAYAKHPYRVARFKNPTGHILEAGPIAVYRQGAFVGEGLTEAVGAGASVTIPFAVDESILVEVDDRVKRANLRITRIRKGLIEAQEETRYRSEWRVRARASVAPRTVLLREVKRSGTTLDAALKGVEELEDAYLVPIRLAAKATEAELAVEQVAEHSRRLSLWEGRVPELLEALLKQPSLTATQRAKLEPLVAQRRAIQRIDSESAALKRKASALDDRAAETRKNLKAIEKDKAASGLRKRLNTSLTEIAKAREEVGRRLVTLATERLDTKLALEDALDNLDLTVSGAP